MSRTIRKVYNNTACMYNWWLGSVWYTPTFHNPKEVDQAKAKSTADHISGMFNIPKAHRKCVVHRRRANDRNEISKLIKDPEYVPNMSPWTCKDADQWGWY